MSFEFVSTDSMRRPPQQSHVGVFRLETGMPLNRASYQPQRNGSEMVPLVGARRSKRYDDYDDNSGFSRYMTLTNLTLCGGISLWITLIVLITFMYWTATESMTAARAEFRPYVTEALDHTMGILRNADYASSDAHGVMDGAQALTGVAVPALQRALNQSSAIVDRLERLAQNPTLQISLASPGGK